MKSIFFEMDHRRSSLMVVAAGVLTLAGCQSAPTAPNTMATALEVTVEDESMPEAPKAQPTSRDGYPNFAGNLSAASVQMGNEEAAALQQQLTALSTARQSGTITEAEYQSRLVELRKLAARHGADTQAQIAN